MDKVILNGNKIRIYNQGNSQSGSIHYTESKLSIKGNSAGSGVLITDGKLHFKDNTTTGSIIYDDSEQQFKLNRPISSSQFIGDGSQLINLPDSGAGIDIINATSGSIPIWSDNQFLDDSPLSISQSKVSSSMPVWSQNIIYSNSSATSMAVGKMPAGVTFDKMSATEILHNILYYQTPALGSIDWDSPVSTYGTSQELSSQLYLKLGDTLSVITASVDVDNYNSFNSGIGLYESTALIASISQPTSDGIKKIIKSNYNKSYGVGTNLSYSTKATSGLQTNIIGGARYIRWREPIYYGYSLNASLTQYDSISVALSGVTQITNTSTTQARSSTATINANANNFYYILFDDDMTNLVSCKDGNNIPILLSDGIGEPGTYAPSNPHQTIDLYNECGSLITYKVYRVYGEQQGPMIITIT